jgi:hypothetical protein
MAALVFVPTASSAIELGRLSAKCTARAVTSTSPRMRQRTCTSASTTTGSASSTGTRARFAGRRGCRSSCSALTASARFGLNRIDATKRPHLRCVRRYQTLKRLGSRVVGAFMSQVGICTQHTVWVRRHARLRSAPPAWGSGTARANPTMGSPIPLGLEEGSARGGVWLRASADAPSPRANGHRRQMLLERSGMRQRDCCLLIRRSLGHQGASTRPPGDIRLRGSGTDQQPTQQKGKNNA